VITSRLTRPVATAAALAVLLTGLAACSRKPSEPTDVVSAVDLARTTVLTSDAVLTKAISPPKVIPGQYRSAQVGWDRSEVSARIYDVRTPPAEVDPTPAEVETQVTAVLNQLREEGWRVHWTFCEPHPAAAPPASASASPAPSNASGPDPTPAPSPQPAPTPSPSPSPAPSPAPAPSASPQPSASATPSASPSEDPARTNVPDELPLYAGIWEEVVLINKVVDGVSYWGMVSAFIVDKRETFIDVVMRAPNAREAANLFPTALPDLAAGSTCAEDGKPSPDIEVAGVPLIIKTWQPFPGAKRSPDPHRL
jgi:hypothetical protein